MRNFIVQVFKQAFADQVGSDLPLIKIGDLLRIIVSRSFRQAGFEFLDQFRDP